MLLITLVDNIKMMKWKYADHRYGCIQKETKEHVLFECNVYGEER